MIKKIIPLLILLIGTVTGLQAGKYYDFSVTAREGYQRAVSLRFGEARIYMDQMRAKEPDNLMVYFIENYVDFLTCFLNEDKAEFKTLAKNMDKRLDKLSAGDPHSPYYLYTQAEIRLQWAILRGKFGDYLTAASDVKQAYALLEENDRKFPDFIANKKSLGIMHTLVGTIPDEYRWSARMFGGMGGTVEQGLAEVETVLKYAQNHDFIFEEETLVAYSFLLLHIGNQSQAAWQTLTSGRLKPTENPLAAFALANLAMKIGKNDEAIRYLENCPTGSKYHPFHYRNFMLGLAKLCRLDGDANVALQDYTNNFHGMHYIKECYQKLAWYHLIMDNRNGYDTYIKYVTIKGYDKLEADKAAQREAESREVPDVMLLKTRLLFDGGYYSRAFDLLKNKAGNYDQDIKKKLEYGYRMGRITHKLGKSQEAIKYYNQTIDAGSREPWYFACNAALQLGILYEEQKDKPNARKAYKRCLDLKPDTYASSLHAKAKAGLQRVK